MKVHPDTFKLIKETADKEGDTVEEFLEDFIEGSFGTVGPEDDGSAEEVEVEPEPRSLVLHKKPSALTHFPKEYQKGIQDLLDEQKRESLEGRMMNALKYVVQQVMTTPGTGDRRDWAQQMLKDIFVMNGDPYTTEVEAALDNLLKRSGYMDLFSFGRSNPMPPPVPDMLHPGDGR